MYANLTPDQKARIQELFAVYTSRPWSILDLKQVAMCIADDLWGINLQKATKQDANRFAAVLTYLVFSGLVKVTLAEGSTKGE